MSTVTQSHPGVLFDFTAKLVTYREYLKQSVMRDLRNRYKRSVLGYLWTMLHPLGMMAILSVLFSHIMRLPIENYAVFLFAGLLPWNYFQCTTIMSLGSIRNNAKLFEQVPVPKYLFIISLSVSNLVNYLLSILPMLGIMLFVGHPIHWTIVTFPIVILPLIFATIGFSLILATGSVFFDDTQHLTEVVLQGLYFLSPVLYYRELLPDHLIKYLVLNPLFCQIEFLRNIFYDGVLPNGEVFLLNTAASALVLIFGLWIFKKCEDKFLYFL